MVKSLGSTEELPMILRDLNSVEVSRTDGVAVKCIDTIKNTDSEGILPGMN